MKKLKLFIKTILMVFFIVLIISFTSCKKNNKNVRIYIPDGTPALALANVLDEGFTYNNKTLKVKFVEASSISGVVAYDDFSLAIMPTVTAAKLYSGNVDINLFTTNVFGNLFILGVNSSEGLESLVGNVVYTTAGTTIDMLKYILTNNDIQFEEGEEPVSGKVSISSKTLGSEIIRLLKQASQKGKKAFGVLGEPALTQAISKIGDSSSIILDFQEEYKKITNGTSYPQASIVGSSSFLNNNKDFMEALYNKLLLNNEYLLSDNLDLNTVLKKYKSSISEMNFTKDTIRRCNIDVKYSYLIKNEINDYIKKLANIDLDDNIYYTL